MNINNITKAEPLIKDYNEHKQRLDLLRGLKSDIKNLQLVSDDIGIVEIGFEFREPLALLLNEMIEKEYKKLGDLSKMIEKL